MFQYKRHIIFFFLGIWENLINFMFSLFRIYPQLDFQFKYWNLTMEESKKRFLNNLKSDGKDIS
jgi:hypothetical protein